MTIIGQNCANYSILCKCRRCTVGGLGYPAKIAHALVLSRSQRRRSCEGKNKFIGANLRSPNNSKNTQAAKHDDDDDAVVPFPLKRVAVTLTAWQKRKQENKNSQLHRCSPRRVAGFAPSAPPLHHRHFFPNLSLMLLATACFAVQHAALHCSRRRLVRDTATVCTSPSESSKPSATASAV